MSQRDWVYRHKICGRCGRTKSQARGAVCDGRMLNPYAEPSEHSWSYSVNQAVKEVTHDDD